MKTVWIRVFVLFAVSVFVYTPDTIAQAHTTLHLPEGAIARLGKGDIKEVTYSPDGRLLAVASALGIVWLYDADTGAEQAFLDGHTSSVESVSFSPDGTTLVSGSRDDTVRLWDINTKSEIVKFTGHTGAVRGVSFSPDGTTIASGGEDTTVRLWDINTKTEIAKLTGA